MQKSCLAAPAGAEELLAVFFRGDFCVLLKHMDKVALGAEAEVVGYLQTGIVGEFQQIFRRFHPLLNNVLADGDTHLAMEQLGEMMLLNREVGMVGIL